MNIRLSTIKRTIATTELLLIAPAALFMTALFVRNVQPEQYEPAHTAQQIVMWYGARPWTLWVGLMALPLAVLVTGCVTVLRGCHDVTELQRARRQPRSSIRRHAPRR